MLHIVACIKQVPDTKIIKMNPKTNTILEWPGTSQAIFLYRIINSVMLALMS